MSYPSTDTEGILSKLIGWCSVPKLHRNSAKNAFIMSLKQKSITR